MFKTRIPNQEHTSEHSSPACARKGGRVPLPNKAAQRIQKPGAVLKVKIEQKEGGETADLRCHGGLAFQGSQAGLGTPVKQQGPDNLSDLVVEHRGPHSTSKPRDGAGQAASCQNNCSASALMEWPKTLQEQMTEWCEGAGIVEGIRGNLEVRLAAPAASSGAKRPSLCLCTDFSGMGTAELVLNSLSSQTPSSPKCLFPEGWAGECYSASDIADIPRRLLRSHTQEEGGPAHIFCNVTERVPVSCLRDIEKLRVAARAECEEWKASHKKSLPVLRGREFLEAVPALVSAKLLEGVCWLDRPLN